MEQTSRKVDEFIAKNIVAHSEIVYGLELATSYLDNHFKDNVVALVQRSLFFIIILFYHGYFIFGLQIIIYFC